MRFFSLVLAIILVALFTADANAFGRRRGGGGGGCGNEAQGSVQQGSFQQGNVQSWSFNKEGHLVDPQGVVYQRNASGVFVQHQHQQKMEVPPLPKKE